MFGEFRPSWDTDKEWSILCWVYTFIVLGIGAATGAALLWIAQHVHFSFH